MKYLFLALLIGCTPGKNYLTQEQIDNIQKLNDQRAVASCHMGILYAIQAFRPHVQGKFKQKEFDKLWNQCDEQ